MGLHFIVDVAQQQGLCALNFSLLHLDMHLAGWPKFAM